MIYQLFENLEKLYPDLVDIRRDLHMYPELSFEETRTPEKVAEYLERLGLEVRSKVGGRGVVGKLYGGKPGKTIALRADFDALPIQDEKEVEYKSRVPGVMHACGHDLHTAALLGVATILSEVRENLEGNIVFIHQFAEEMVPGGSKSMIEDGCLDGIDVIYGAHVISRIPSGVVGIKEGHMMAAGDKFEIEITGKGGHGAHPHLTVDPILVGSQIVMNLQQIISRSIDPTNSAVLSIGSFNSGETFNIIPHTAKITGTVRTFEEDDRNKVEELIGQIAASTCEGAGATLNYQYHRGYPSVWNHPAETGRIKKLALELVGKEKMREIRPFMAMDDFAYYLKELPGAYFLVGGGNEDIGATYPHHHPKFDVDERAILLIGKLFISVIFDYFSSPSND